MFAANVVSGRHATSTSFPSCVLGIALLALGANACAQIPASERNALIAFYNATGGQGWSDSTGWNGAAGTECNWFGVKCDDNATTVTQLLFAGNQLVGTLPSLSDLPNLVSLYVQNNQLSGTVPSFAALTQLQEIYLNGNQFSGPLPSVAGLTQLINYDVSGNQFSGALMSLAGTSIVYFNAENNQLTGSIPSFAGATNLQIYAVDSNPLSGSIPALNVIPQLQQFGAGYAGLSGSLPSLQGMTSLAYFNAAGNQLTGTLPTLGDAPALTGYDVSNNHISGTIPALASVTLLQQIWLDGNELTGSVPALTGLTSLQSVGVSYNKLNGTLPSLAGLVNLQNFYAGNNQLTGTIPSLSGLTNLQNFDVDGNLLTGSAPTLAGLTKLVYFSIAHNQLSGPVPALAGLSQLFDFDVSFNELNGPIPALSGLPNLEYAYFDFNQLSGSIPSLTDLTRLEEFVVLDNQLTGTIPPLSGLANLHVFNAESNQLSGALPALSGLLQLRYFSVTGNQISGPLPPLSGLSNLSTFDVSFNKISGSIPALNGLPNLQYLYLGVNQLSDSIPSLGGLSNLLVFDADANQLSGSIPALSALGNLQEFNVYSNRLTGTLPALTGLANLQAFEVGENRISGAIPAVPAPNNLVAGLSSLCPNLLAHTSNGEWDAATGLSPWFLTCTDTASTNGQPTTKDSTQIVLSRDGKVKLFQSQQTDLTADNANAGGQDVYSVSANGAPVLESIDAGGHKLIGTASAPAISPDGKVIAFLYAPGAALSADANSLQLYAGAQGAPKHRVDTGTGGAAPNGPVSSAPSLSSASGTYQLAFCSAASNLVSGDSNGLHDVFVATPMNAAAPIQRLSLDAGAQEIAGDSCEPKLSSDGTKLVFSLASSGLYGTTARQIVTKDLGNGSAPAAGPLKLITPAAGTTHGANGDSSEPVINDDGTVVAFTSTASNLDGMGAPIGGHEVFVALSPAGTPRIQRARAGDGAAPNGGSQHPQLSGDGSVVVMQTDATNFLRAPTLAQDTAAPAPPQCGAVAVTTNFSSVTGMGAPLCNGTTQNQSPSISGDGSTVGFDSNAPQSDGSDNRNAYAQGIGTYTGISGLTIPNLSGDYSGQWFDPSQNGHGLVLDVTQPDSNNQRLLVMTWFVYLNGQPTWVQGVGVPRAGAGTAANTVIVQMDEVDIFRGAGFPLGAAQATPSRWGSAALTFTDASTGTLTWRSTYPGFGFGSMPIKHFLAVGVPAQDAPGARVKACYSGNWFNSAQNGHGFELEVLPGANPLLVVDWFAYAPGGAPVWLQGVGSISGNTAQVPLQIYSGPGAQFPPNFDPGGVTAHDWGTATFTFADSTHAQVTWNSPIAGYGSGTQSLQPILRIDRRDCN